MMFVGSRWKVVLVTTHLPLQEVPKWITAGRVLSKIQMADEGLKEFFGIAHPRIAVLGLNPHCGEEGLLGEEEEKEILPAIREARSQGWMWKDLSLRTLSLICRVTMAHFDAVISMYHDQGLIPIKMFDFKGGCQFHIGAAFYSHLCGPWDSLRYCRPGIGRSDQSDPSHDCGF